MTERIDHGYYCKNCRFGEPNPDGKADGDADIIECHRYPPSYYSRETDVWLWPETTPHETCGEWKPVFGDHVGYADGPDGKPLIPNGV